MLETNRLILRPMKPEDSLNLFLLNQDPEVLQWTGDQASHNLADAQRILTDHVYPQFQLYKMGRFAVLLKDGTWLGWCGLKYFPETNEVDLGYRFMKKYWGQGYATEACEACLEYGFEVLKIKKIIARAMPQNLPSIKVLQKLKMTYTGLKNDSHYPGGYVIYELSAEDYRKCKNS
jgi:ribosomal-protein-alanine N-acetyltransferase